MLQSATIHRMFKNKKKRCPYVCNYGQIRIPLICSFAVKNILQNCFRVTMPVIIILQKKNLQPEKRKSEIISKLQVMRLLYLRI